MFMFSDLRLRRDFMALPSGKLKNSFGFSLPFLFRPAALPDIENFSVSFCICLDLASLASPKWLWRKFMTRCIGCIQESFA